MIVRSRVSSSQAVPGEVRSSTPLSWTQLLAAMVSGDKTVVTADSAMRHDAVWACVRLIAGTMSTFPLDVFAVRDGDRVEVRSGLLENPSGYVDGVDWVYQIMESLLLRGNAYGIVTAVSPQMFPTQIDMISADTVSWVDGVPHVDGKPRRLWPSGDLWHLPAYVRAGSPVGLSPIAYHAETIGVGLSAKRFGKQWFDDGAHPTHVIAPERDPGVEGAKDLKQRFMELTRGNREPIVLPQSVKLERIQVAPDESQFLDTQRISVEQVARIFGVAPEMIGAASSGSSITYASLEQRSLGFVTYTLLWWVTKLERSLSRLHPRGQTVRARTAGLLKADLAGRYASYKTAAEIGRLTGEPLLLVEEMRQFEDLPGLTDEQREAAKQSMPTGPLTATPSAV
jgi:HK97 family phage portal protein